MKKTILTIIIIALFSAAFSQAYLSDLTKLNNYLRTFDNGYYGSLKIADGFLIDNFKSGDYTKTPIKELTIATEETAGSKVILECKNGKECVFSTYTNSYHNKISFSQSSNFNTSELITLLNNLLDSYNGKTTKIKSSTTQNNSTTNTSKNLSKANNILQQINNFLKTFDNGYYGSLKIADGYLIDNFKSGEYTKTKMSDLNYALVTQTNRKVTIKCKAEKECVFSTYTDGYHEELNFSQTTDFDSKKFSDLLNEFIDNYNGKENTTENTITSTNTVVKNTPNNSINLKDALKQINKYLETFDNGYYGHFEINDEDIYLRFKAGKYDKFEMKEMEGAIIQEQYKRVIFKCNGSNQCISTDWKINGQEDYIQFLNSSVFNYQELATLLNNFRDAYLSKNISTTETNTTIKKEENRDRKAIERFNNSKETTTKEIKNTSNSSTNSTTNYKNALKNLNAYLKTFNAETYNDIEVKDGNVYFSFNVFSKKYYTSIGISELKQNTFVFKSTSSGTEEIKILCNDKNYCFYSTYNLSKADHFRFYSNTIKDLTKMKTLLEEFISAL